jgi:hypothetical protein
MELDVGTNFNETLIGKFNEVTIEDVVFGQFRPAPTALFVYKIRLQR